jgi:hypothetical protein
LTNLKTWNIFRGVFMRIKTVLFTALAAAALCAGCQTVSLGVYDPTVPPEKLCTLEVPVSLTVKRFDGEKVTWISLSGINIEIPEGSHEFVIDYSEPGQTRTVGGTGAYGSSWQQSQTASYTAKGIEFRYDFAAGNTYVMAPEISGGYAAIRMTKKSASDK